MSDASGQLRLGEIRDRLHRRTGQHRGILLGSVGGLWAAVDRSDQDQAAEHLWVARVRASWHRVAWLWPTTSTGVRTPATWSASWVQASISANPSRGGRGEAKAPGRSKVMTRRPPRASSWTRGLDASGAHHARGVGHDQQRRSRAQVVDGQPVLDAGRRGSPTGTSAWAEPLPALSVIPLPLACSSWVVAAAT